MLSKLELWKKLEDLLEDKDLELFDIEMPAVDNITLKVFIKEREGKSAKLEHCELVGREISNDPDLGSILDSYKLEVSSPGVNRKLRRPEHFSGAIDEHVYFQIKEPIVVSDKKYSSLRGVLKSFDGEGLEIELDLNHEKFKFNLKDISKIRVDYLFE